MVWDVVFYGNKLFQGKFIKIIEGSAHPTIYSILEYSLVNCTIAMLGYWCAAAVIDKPWMGRLRLQLLGFTMVTIVFLLCGLCYDDLVKKENIHTFQFLYYLSSFFGQFGPNCTTFLLAAELYPTEVRTVAHGFSATMGKCGALFAAIYFKDPSLSASSIFLTCGWCGLIGWFITLLFVADVTTLNSKHIDLQWKAIREGKPESYVGPASNREYQSFFEIYCLGKGGSSEHSGVHDKVAFQSMRDDTASGDATIEMLPSQLTSYPVGCEEEVPITLGNVDTETAESEISETPPGV